METRDPANRPKENIGPHSLGKSVEWKLDGSSMPDDLKQRPHSLGKSVEWKLEHA